MVQALVETAAVQPTGVCACARQWIVVVNRRGVQWPPLLTLRVRLGPLGGVYKFMALQHPDTRHGPTTTTAQPPLRHAPGARCLHAA